MKKNKAIIYRLYPTPEQAVFFEKTLGCCRKIWNLMLADKIAYYEETGKTLYPKVSSYYGEHPYLKEVDSSALGFVKLNLDAAYKNFFRDPKVGYPKFKSAKQSRKSYKSQNKMNCIRITDKGIRLPKVGVVKASIHRFPNRNWILKSATVSRSSDGNYYVSVLFAFETEVTPVPKASEKAIGIHYIQDGLFVDSNGNIGSQHKYYCESQEKLAREQRKLKNKTVGSNNYKKQQIRVGKIHRHIASQRLDFLHKLSTEIANRYDIVCVEKIDLMSAACKESGGGKETLDNGYGMFLEMLKYKQADRGHFFVMVDKVESGDYGNEIDSDHDAANYIRQEGIRLLMEAK